MDIDKKTMKIIVFGIIGIMSLIIFAFLMGNMYEVKEKDNISRSSEQEKNNTSTSKEETKKEDNVEYYYDFERIKLDDICEVNASKCETIIGTIKDGDKTKILGFKYSGEKLKETTEYVIQIDNIDIYKFNNNEIFPSEFISFKNEYLVIVLNNGKINNGFIILDKSGTKILEDNYVKSDLLIADSTINYKTLNCELNDNYIYNAVIKLINGKPKVILQENTKEKSTEYLCK